MLPAGLVQAQTWISTAGSVLELLLILRTLQLGLVRCYPRFFAFLICDLGRDLCLRYLERDLTTQSYAIAWAISAPVLWVALVSAILEIYQRFYRAVTATREVRAMIVSTAILASIVITLSVSAELIDSLSTLASWQDAVRITNRFVFMAGALVLWTQGIFFLRARPLLPHNVRIHRIAFTLYLSADATVRFLSALRDPIVAMRANLVCSTLFCAALIIWIFGFHADGEKPHAPLEVVSEERRAF